MNIFKKMIIYFYFDNYPQKVKNNRNGDEHEY